MPQVIQPYADPSILENHASRHVKGGLDPLSASDIGAADVGHNHDSAYASESHNHDSAYAPKSHNHNSVYAVKEHDHAGVYAELDSDGTVKAEQLPASIPVSVEWDIINGKPDSFPPSEHTHSEYALVGHTHDEEPEYWGFDIDFSVSNPASCITFTGNAALLTAAERKAWVYTLVSPNTVKNARINYALDRANLAKKADGSASNLTGTDGDVCASFRPIWWKANKHGTILSVKIYLEEVPGAATAHRFNGSIREYVHIGMFEATGSTCASIYSTSTTPTVSQTLNTFRTQAKTKGGTYNPVTFLTWTMYQLLYIMAYGTLNTQAKTGNGNVSTSASIAVGSASLLTANGEYGSTTASNTHCMALYVVNPWGNVWMFLDGIIWNSGNVAMLTDQADVYNIESGYASRPATWHAFASGITAADGAGGYCTSFGGDAYGVTYPASYGGTSETHVCDYFYMTTGERCCLFGGGWDNGARAGLFSLSCYYALSVSGAAVGARVQILNAV